MRGLMGGAAALGALWFGAAAAVSSEPLPAASPAGQAAYPSARSADFERELSALRQENQRLRQQLEARSRAGVFPVQHLTLAQAVYVLQALPHLRCVAAPSILLLSPFDLVEASIDRRRFPQGANHWDRIGLFQLDDRMKPRLVLLYYSDTDSIAGKTTGSFFYPNFFDVHAMYQDKAGRWVHKELFGYARVQFLKVAKVSAQAVVLECRPNFIIMQKPGEDGHQAMKRWEEVNRPFTKSVSFVRGELAAK